MTKKIVFKVKDGETTVKYKSFDANGAENIEIYLPSSIAELDFSVLDNAEDKTVRVFFGGTAEQWKKIKKGLLEKTTIKHDWYGYYYHNAEPQIRTKETYFNWISDAKSVTILCSDGELTDDPEKNKLNPLKLTNNEYWDDD